MTPASRREMINGGMGEDWWWRDLVARWYPADSFQPDLLARRYYHVKREIALLLRPTSICEIGVRAGYSAVAFLSAVPEAEYLGIDDGLCDRESGEAYLAHARRLLEHYKASLLQTNSRTMDRLPWTSRGVPFEFVHVDADHSGTGCLSDLTLADASGARWILVDDYDVGADIRNACHTFLAAVGARWRETYYPDGYRGSLLLTKVGV